MSHLPTIADKKNEKAKELEKQNFYRMRKSITTQIETLARFYLQVIQKNAKDIKNAKMVKVIDEILSGDAYRYLIKPYEQMLKWQKEYGKGFRPTKEQLLQAILDMGLPAESLTFSFMGRLAFDSCYFTQEEYEKVFNKASHKAKNYLLQLIDFWENYWSFDKVAISIIEKGITESHRNLVISIYKAFSQLLDFTNGVLAPDITSYMHPVVLVKESPLKGRLAHNRNKNNTPKNREFCYIYFEQKRKEAEEKGEWGWTKEVYFFLSEKFEAERETIRHWIYLYKQKMAFH